MPTGAHIARRALRWLAALVIAVLLVAGFTLTTNLGLRLLLALGLPFYNDRIAGTVAIGGVDGRLLGRFTLRDVVLSDRTGQPLVTAHALAVDWSPSALTRGLLRVGELRLERPRVRLGGDFADLAPPGEPVPEDLSSQPGPDLPIAVDIDLHLRDGALFAADGAPLAVAAELDVRARGSGRVAIVDITGGQAHLAGAHALRGLRLRARWAAPVAALDDLRVRVDAAELVVPSARLDVDQLRGAARLHATAALAGLAEFLSPETAAALRPLGPQVRLAAALAGGPEDMSAELRLTTAAAALTIAGTGAFRDVARTDLRLTADLDLAPWTAGPLGRVRPTLDLHARAVGDGRFTLVGGLQCTACDDLGPVSAAFDGVVDGPRKGLSLETSLSLAGVAALVDLRALGGELRELTWRLSAPELARTAAVARRFVPALPAVRGALTGRGVCTGPALRCAGALELRRLVAAGTSLAFARLDVQAKLNNNLSAGTLAIVADDVRRDDHTLDRAALALALTGLDPVAAPPLADLPPLRADLRAAAIAAGDRARLDLSVATGPEIHADLRALELVHGDHRVTLDRPAHAVVRARSLEVDDLELDLGRGQLSLAGLADLDGASDLRLELDQFPLATLRPLAPGLRPAGLAAATAHLRGRPEAPELRADLVIRRLGLRGRSLGDLDLAAQLGDGRGALELDLRGPLARRLAIRADLPLRVDLSAGTYAIGDHHPELELRVEQLRLPHLAPALGGRVDGNLRVTGNSQQSTQIAGTWQARDLAVDRVPLGDLTLDLTHCGDQLEARAELRRAGGRARLELQVPLTLDLQRHSFAWRRERDHHLLLRVAHLDLADQLGSLIPDHRIAGQVDLQVELSGPADDFDLETELRARDLRHDDMSYGSYHINTLTRAGGTVIALAGGGAAGRLELDALAPVGLGVDGMSWRPDGWYALELDLRAIDLAALRPLVGVAMAGRVHGHLGLAGRGQAPRFHGSVRGDSLEFDGDAVGRLGADLELRDGTATVAARGRLGRATDLQLDARVPLDVDLGARTIRWSSARSGSLHLDVTGIDRAALAPIHRLPPDALVDLDLHVHTDLDLRGVHAQASLTGAIGRTALGTTPLVVRLDVDDRHQTLRADLGWQGDRSALALVVDTEASIDALRRGRAELLATPIRGAITARGADLRHLSGLLPSALHDLTGALFADLDLRGRLGRPVVRGPVHLRDGAITVVPLQQRFRDLAVDLVVDGPKFRLDRLVATSGEGRLRATGDATLSADNRLTGAAVIDLKRFPFVRPGWPQMTVDSRVRTSVDARPGALAVEIAVAGAEVWVSDFKTRAPDPIPTNDNVVIRRGLRPAEPAPTHDEPDPTNMSISVDLEQPVHIQGPALDMRWAGKVTSRSAGDHTQVTGAFRSDRGRFELLGTTFRIEHGRVFLPAGAGAIDPFIDLAADARTEQHDVTVTLRGRLSRPDLDLKSQPPLPEPQIFSLLLTGTTDSERTDPNKAQASAAGLLLNFSNPTLARFADQRLGIDRIKFGFADDLRQPVLTIGKHLSKTVYGETTYHHNAPPRYNRIEIRIEYRFAPAWSIETFFGDAAVGGLDVFWRRRFGRLRLLRR